MMEGDEDSMDTSYHSNWNDDSMNRTPYGSDSASKVQNPGSFYTPATKSTAASHLSSAHSNMTSPDDAVMNLDEKLKREQEIHTDEHSGHSDNDKEEEQKPVSESEIPDAYSNKEGEGVVLRFIDDFVLENSKGRMVRIEDLDDEDHPPIRLRGFLRSAPPPPKPQTPAPTTPNTTGTNSGNSMPGHDGGMVVYNNGDMTSVQSATPGGGGGASGGSAKKKRRPKGTGPKKLKKLLALIDDIKEWCIDYADPPILWVVTDDAWYRLLKPAKRYTRFFRTAKMKFESCTLIHSMLLAQPRIGFKSIMDKLTDEKVCTKEDEFMEIIDFVINQLEEVDEGALAGTQLLQKLRWRAVQHKKDLEKQMKREAEKKEKLKEREKEKEEKKKVKEIESKEKEKLRAHERDLARKLRALEAKYPMEDIDLMKELQRIKGERKQPPPPGPPISYWFEFPQFLQLYDFYKTYGANLGVPAADVTQMCFRLLSFTYPSGPAGGAKSKLNATPVQAQRIQTAIGTTTPSQQDTTTSTASSIYPYNFTQKATTPSAAPTTIATLSKSPEHDQPTGSSSTSGLAGEEMTPSKREGEAETEQPEPHTKGLNYGTQKESTCGTADLRVRRQLIADAAILLLRTLLKTDDINRYASVGKDTPVALTAAMSNASTENNNGEVDMDRETEPIETARDRWLWRCLTWLDDLTWTEILRQLFLEDPWIRIEPDVKSLLNNLRDHDPGQLNAEEQLQLFGMLLDVLSEGPLREELDRRQEAINELMQKKKQEDAEDQKRLKLIRQQQQQQQSTAEDETINGSAAVTAVTTRHGTVTVANTPLTEEQKFEAERKQKDIAFELKLSELAVRRESLGFDRYHNAYWFFPEDVYGRVFIQEGEDSGRWGVYDDRQQIDSLLEWLNPKGIRESRLESNVRRLYDVICETLDRKKPERLKLAALPPITHPPIRKAYTSEPLTFARELLLAIEDQLSKAAMSADWISKHSSDWRKTVQSCSTPVELSQVLVTLEENLVQSRLVLQKNWMKRRQAWMFNARACETCAQLSLQMYCFRDRAIDWGKVNDLAVPIDRDSWLRLVKPKQRAYIPTLGETVLYFKTGHFVQMSEIESRGVPSDESPPLDAYTHQLTCVVENIAYYKGSSSLPVVGATTPFARLWLRPVCVGVKALQGHHGANFEVNEENKDAVLQNLGLVAPPLFVSPAPKRVKTETSESVVASQSDAMQTDTQAKEATTATQDSIVPGTNGDVVMKDSSLATEGSASQSSSFVKTEAEDNKSLLAKTMSSADVSGMFTVPDQFIVTVQLNNQLPEFLIPEDRFMACVDENWIPNQRFQMYFQTTATSGEYFRGTIKQVRALDNSILLANLLQLMSNKQEAPEMMKSSSAGSPIKAESTHVNAESQLSTVESMDMEKTFASSQDSILTSPNHSQINSTSHSSDIPASSSVVNSLSSQLSLSSRKRKNERDRTAHKEINDLWESVLVEWDGEDDENSNVNVNLWELEPVQTGNVTPSSSKGKGGDKKRKVSLDSHGSNVVVARRKYDVNRLMNQAVCSQCEKPGEMISCDGPCLRFYHAACIQPPIKNVAEPWTCKDCELRRHACFSCGRVGEDDQERGVKKCSLVSCGKFYHIDCAERLTLCNFGGGGRWFRCPLHYCAVCRKSAVSTNQDGEESHAVISCSRCPTAYHKQCLPSVCIQSSPRVGLCAVHSQQYRQVQSMASGPLPGPAPLGGSVPAMTSAVSATSFLVQGPIPKKQ
eukprot:GILK01007866.1.p1 GENE.GILK01007866.1~~GILK01007866.1.p1  ORF type:complete len:1744 (+),score=331.74 GILK01007866.1:38-5269(+)